MLQYGYRMLVHIARRFVVATARPLESYYWTHSLPTRVYVPKYLVHHSILSSQHDHNSRLNVVQGWTKPHSLTNVKAKLSATANWKRECKTIARTCRPSVPPTDRPTDRPSVRPAGQNRRHRISHLHIEWTRRHDNRERKRNVHGGTRINVHTLMTDVRRCVVFCVQIFASSSSLLLVDVVVINACAYVIHMHLYVSNICRVSNRCDDAIRIARPHTCVTHTKAHVLLHTNIICENVMRRNSRNFCVAYVHRFAIERTPLDS